MKSGQTGLVTTTGGNQQGCFQQPWQGWQAALGANVCQFTPAHQEEECSSKEEAAGGPGRAECPG